MFSPKFKVKINESVKVIGTPELEVFARKYQINRYAPARYSWYFLLQLMMYQQKFGVEPAEIVEAIKELEIDGNHNLIKPATQFRHLPLKGLWHKHYFSARFMAQNLQLHHGKNGIKKILNKHWTPGQDLTDDILRTVAEEFTFKAFEDRADSGKLTGEWLVFAKYKGENFYLALGEHEGDHQSLYDAIKTLCVPQFNFLADILNSEG
ncbi:hypothetical protein V9J52_003394 [Vibrio cholerae]|nr:hypothetical protein [Vibrio cholerae]GIA07562.1 hypothetical protein VCSRO83_3627 [Vibrio cholerae]